MIGRRASPSAEDIEGPRGFDDFDLRLGDIMRGERATLGKSLLDVQRDLKIKATYIAAIENADPTAFESQGFIAGYVRSYARYLGMDPEWAFQRFCTEAGFATAHGMSAAASTARPTRPVSHGKPFGDPLGNPNATFVPHAKGFFADVQPGAVGSILVLVALLGGIGYGGWSVMQQIQRVQVTPVEQTPGVTATLDPIAGASERDFAEAGDDENRVALPTTESLGRLYRPQTLDTPVLDPRDGPIASIKPGSVGALVGQGLGPTALAESAPQAPAAPSGMMVPNLLPVDVAGLQLPGSVQVTASAGPAVEVIAVRPSWVRVSAADGTVMLEKILDAGERYVVPQTEFPAVLRAGNSGSVYFGVNGQTFGPAAPGAQVVKNIALSPESLRTVYALADLTADPDLASIVKVAAVAPLPQVPAIDPAATEPAVPSLPQQ